MSIIHVPDCGGPMHLEIRHLKLVAAVAETGSVTRAGNRLHLTQSALSHQLRDAEEQLGKPLFERKSGKMTLTPAGERVLQTARAGVCGRKKGGKMGRGAGRGRGWISGGRGIFK